MGSDTIFMTEICMTGLNFLTKLSDNSKLEREREILEGGATSHRDLNSLEDCVDRSCVRSVGSPSPGTE